jgi:hypothetical protein
MGVTEPDFVGHLDGENLILITSATRAPTVQTYLHKRLADFSDNLYPLQARLQTTPAQSILKMELSATTQTAPALNTLAALKSTVLSAAGR